VAKPVFRVNTSVDWYLPHCFAKPLSEQCMRDNANKYGDHSAIRTLFDFIHKCGIPTPLGGSWTQIAKVISTAQRRISRQQPINHLYLRRKCIRPQRAIGLWWPSAVYSAKCLFRNWLWRERTTLDFATDRLVVEPRLGITDLNAPTNFSRVWTSWAKALAAQTPQTEVGLQKKL